ncbi:MAG: hypothetical protein ABH824_02470 [Nanoarchaeota archaeon]|nr:hypothetical protein [Nanoarchaeota archaeon]MBU1632445.1 hypothetical protein [Nanoarchaeota archaeon]MBU1876337.1 hypothetical protein [Nanoarchaeota archaeon]
MDTLITVLKNQHPHNAPDTRPYNALGAIYSFLPREKKDEVLGVFLQQLGRINYFYVQIHHTPAISEPSLLSDIQIINPRYWPGMDEGKAIVKKFDNFAGFHDFLMGPDGIFRAGKVQSDFLVAYAALRSDMSPFGSEYAAACYPDFLERIVDGIVDMRLNMDIGLEEGKARLRELLPTALHPKLEKSYQRTDRINPKNFK